MSMRSIYRRIARESGVTVTEVKRDIQQAIHHTYSNTPSDGITTAYQNKIPSRGKVPTPEEVIKYAVNEVRKREGG